MKLTWTRTAHYPGTGPDHYECEKIPYGRDYQKTYAQGFVQTRVNGPCTAYAQVRYTCEWGSNSLFGLDINKHFLGSHAGQQARAWCAFLITNPLSSWRDFREEMKP